RKDKALILTRFVADLCGITRPQRHCHRRTRPADNDIAPARSRFVDRAVRTLETLTHALPHSNRAALAEVGHSAEPRQSRVNVIAFVEQSRIRAKVAPKRRHARSGIIGCVPGQVVTVGLAAHQSIALNRPASAGHRAGGLQRISESCPTRSASDLRSAW